MGIFSSTTYFVLIALLVGTMVSSGISGDRIIESFDEALTNSTSDIVINTPSQPEIGNAISYYLTGMLSAFKELTKWVVGFVVDNPQAPYKLLLYGLMLAIIAPILLIVFKMVVIIFLLIKEYVQNRKHKKYLEKLQNGRTN